MTGNLLCFHLALTHLISYFVCLADGVQLALNFAFGRIKFLIDTVASTSFVFPPPFVNLYCLLPFFCSSRIIKYKENLNDFLNDLFNVALFTLTASSMNSPWPTARRPPCLTAMCLTMSDVGADRMKRSNADSQTSRVTCPGNNWPQMNLMTRFPSQRTATVVYTSRIGIT